MALRLCGLRPSHFSGRPSSSTLLREFAQRPLLDDLPAFCERRIVLRRAGLLRLRDHCPAGVELVALTGVCRTTHRQHERSRLQRNAQHHPSRCRASFAPAPSAASLASAISRRIGAMPQLVVATMLLFGTNFATASIVATTSSAVST